MDVSNMRMESPGSRSLANVSLLPAPGPRAGFISIEIISPSRRICSSISCARGAFYGILFGVSIAALIAQHHTYRIPICKKA